MISKLSCPLSDKMLIKFKSIFIYFRYGQTVRVLSNKEWSPVEHLDDTTLKSCHRCSKVVYVAEENVTNGRSYHKSCTKCNKCNRQLDLQTLYDAPDQEIYCSGEILELCFCKICLSRPILLAFNLNYFIT